MLKNITATEPALCTNAPTTGDIIKVKEAFTSTREGLLLLISG